MRQTRLHSERVRGETEDKRWEADENLISDDAECWKKSSVGGERSLTSLSPHLPLWTLTPSKLLVNGHLQHRHRSLSDLVTPRPLHSPVGRLHLFGKLRTTTLSYSLLHPPNHCPPSRKAPWAHRRGRLPLSPQATPRCAGSQEAHPERGHGGWGDSGRASWNRHAAGGRGRSREQTCKNDESKYHSTCV